VPPVQPDLEPTSLHIGRKGGQSQYYADEQAERIGLPLNQLVTINFRHTTIDPRQAVPAFAAIRARYSKWSRRVAALQPTYGYVFENSEAGVPYLVVDASAPHNVHVHWRLHIPPKRFYEFQDILWDWLEAVVGSVDDINAVQITPITKGRGLALYLNKGVQSSWSHIYAKGRHEPQGLIVGRRTGTSRNIRNAARIASDRAVGLLRRVPIGGQPPPGRSSAA
jgi:hypothetical protein